MIKRIIITGLMAGTVVVGGAAATGVASAANVKDCGTTVAETGPGNSGFTQSTTTTQTSACNSNSDTGQQTTTGPVTNRGGGTPGGQQ
jgi:hypothetical protein